MQTNDGRLIVVSGASRSGKTAYVVRAVKAEKRLAVWDIEAQWCAIPGWKKITTRADLFKAIQKPGNAKLAYVARGDVKAEFDFFAGCAKYWGEFHGGCVVVAEELADVSTPSKAPGNWGMMQRRGLTRGLTIYAISQRWAEADKTAIGNASEFVCFRATGDDVAYMARKTRIPVTELENLKPLEFIRQSVTGERERGILKFR